MNWKYLLLTATFLTGATHALAQVDSPAPPPPPPPTMNENGEVVHPAGSSQPPIVFKTIRPDGSLADMPQSQRPRNNDADTAAQTDAQQRNSAPAPSPAPAPKPMSRASKAAAEKSERDELIYRTNLGRADDVLILLAQGASITTTDASGAPLISLASARRDDEGINVVKALLKAGADINSKDNKGQTPLFYAAKNGNMDIVKYLLDNGADYYALDNQGNIARNVAYNERYQDVADAMDEFVRQLAVKRNKQYEELNEQIAENYRKVQEQAMQAAQAQAKRHNPPPPPAPAAAPVVTPPPPPPPPVAAAPADANPPVASAPAPQAAVEPPKEPENKELQELAAKKREQEAAKLFQSYSYANCMFEYWYFCNGAGKSTELGESLSATISDYRDQVVEQGDRLRNDYKMGQQGLDKVAESAKKRIFNQLNAMPSNTYRQSQGVGKKSDAKQRCEDISRDWNSDVPANLAMPRVSKADAGGIGGVSQSDYNDEGEGAGRVYTATPINQPSHRNDDSQRVDMQPRNAQDNRGGNTNNGNTNNGGNGGAPANNGNMGGYGR